jgi:YidC/Oxa1 family membrane protein insertase
MQPNQKSSLYNFIFAFALSFAIIQAWDYFFPSKARQQILSQQQVQILKPFQTSVSRKILTLENDKIKLSFDLNNFLIDEVFLKDYNKSILRPVDQKDFKYLTFGVLANGADENLKWSVVDSKKNYIKLIGKNNDMELDVLIKLDEYYGAKIEQKLQAKQDISGVSFYMQSVENNPSVTKNNPSHHGYVILPEDEQLKELAYKKIKKSNKVFALNQNSWVATSFKYWFTLMQGKNYNLLEIEFAKDSNEIYATTKTSFKRLKNKEIAQNDSYVVFGAKKFEILENYEKILGVVKLDKIIDLGFFHFIAKPILSLTNLIYEYVKNYGVAFIIVTVFVKIFLFFFSKKSYIGMQKIKELQPKVNDLKEKYKDNKQTFNLEVMKLYKTHNVNPISGFLPIIIQIPIFLAMYKVFSVCLEFRGQPFFGWIVDISKPDSLSVFNLFGLLPFSVPDSLKIGPLPLLMGFTMFLHQKMSSNAAMDKQQQAVMNLMPFFFVFMFSSFPAGLMLYWITSNIFSIVQQYILTKNAK